MTNLLHYLVIGGWISYTLSIECIVGWTTRKTLPFCFSPILITSCLHRKNTRLSLWYIFVFWESLEVRLLRTHTAVNAKEMVPYPTWALNLGGGEEGMPMDPSRCFFTACNSIFWSDQTEPTPCAPPVVRNNLVNQTEFLGLFPKIRTDEIAKSLSITTLPLQQ